MGGKSAARDVEMEVLRLMTELARYLISVGISIPRITAIARLAYFQAAAAEAKFANKKLNQSAVAAMTGLTRVQVRKFAKQTNPGPARSRNRLDAVVAGWSADPAFTTSKFEPRKLRVAGVGASFSALARRYGGDITPRALLRELQRNGFVSVRDRYVTLKAQAAKSRSDHRMRVIARTMADLIERDPGVTLASFPIRGLNLETEFPATVGKSRVLIQRRAEEGLKTYLAGLETMGAATAAASSSRPRRGASRTRARVLMIMEDVDR